MVFAKFRNVVEGIFQVKLRLGSLTNAKSTSIQETCLDLFRQLTASDFVRKISETFATRLLLVGIGLITTVIVTRVLGPEGRGLYAVATSMAAIGVQFGNLGLHASNTYYVAKDRELLGPLIGNTFLVSFVLGGFGIALVWLTVFLRPDLSPIHGGLFVLVLMSIPFGLAYILLQSLLLGIQEIRAYNKIDLITRVLGVGLVGLVILSDVITVELVFCTSFVVSVIGFGWVTWHLRPYLRRFPVPSFGFFKENVRYGVKAYLAAFFAFLVLRIDVLMIQQILGAEQTGYYSVAVSMADMIYMFPVIIGTVLFPTLSSMQSNYEKWEFTKKVLIGLSLTMLVLIIFSSLFAKVIVQILFGEEFITAVPAFRWLMPGIFFLSVNTLFMNYFAATGMPMITVYSPAVAAILNIILNMKLIPMLGIVGASISSLLAYGLMLVMSVLYSSKLKRKIA